MLKKRIIAAVMLLMMVFSCIGESNIVLAETTGNETTENEIVVSPNTGEVTTNLKLEQEVFQKMEMAAGGTLHMKLLLSMKEGYCIEPVFTIKPKNNAPLTISNVTVTSAEQYHSSILYMDDITKVYLEYDITVDDFAKIGTYEYGITFKAKEEWDGYAQDVPPAGELIMKIAVVGEKMRPQISVVSGGEVVCNAGEIVNLSVTLKNEGELQAMNTYVFADYSDCAAVLTPTYTLLNQKVGNMAPKEEKVIELSYKVASDATAQRVKIPLVIDYKLANGENAASSDASAKNAYVYINIQGTGEEKVQGAKPVISGITQTPETPKAGQKLDISFELSNNGNEDMKEVKIVLNDLGNTGFLPMSPEPDVALGTLKAGEKKKVNLQVKVGKEIPEGFNKLKVTIEYQAKNDKGVYATTQEQAELYILNVQNPKEDVAKDTLKAAVPYINNVSQSPEIPVAGEELTVSFQVVNDGNVDIRGAKIVLESLGDTSFLPTSAEPYITVGTIAAGSKKNVKLKVKVGDKIPEGFNRLNFSLEYQGWSDGTYVAMTEPVELYILNVQNSEDDGTISRPKLMVSNFYTDVEEVKAGNVFDFTFEILNTNDSIAAKNIKVTVTGASNAFSVTSGGNSFFVDKIEPQATEPITINLKASAAATTGAYPITIKMEYEYEGIKVTETYSGETVQEEILLQVKENLRPSVENVYVGSWDTPMVNQPTTMSFEFYNMGKSTLNNTYVTIEGDFMLSNGSNSYYIGNIAAGMPEYIEFDVVPLIEGDATGKMIIHMEDSNGDEVTMEKEFTAYIMGEMSWEDPGYMDPGYVDPGFYEDPSMQTGSDAVEKPILPLWLFLCIQGAILAIVIPVSRACRLAAYRKKVRMEDAV